MSSHLYAYLTTKTKGTDMSNQNSYVKINHTLPQEVVTTFKSFEGAIDKRNAYIVAIRNNQWSLQSIADVVGTTRERIRQISEGFQGTPLTSNVPLPTPPLKPVREKRVLPEPKEEDIKRLLKLQPLAQKVRSHSQANRKEAEEYTALLFKVYKEDGVSLFRLAKYLGVTHGALRFRMARYGYIEGTSSKSTCYKPILDKNRYVLNS